MASSSEQQDIPSSKYLKWVMRYAEVRLEITNAESMMVHHTIIWNTVNVSRDPWTMHDINVASIVPRKTEEIKLKVREERAAGQEKIAMPQPKVIDISRGNLLTKSFLVEMAEPLMPNDESRTLITEYDWEEPDRFYQYGFSNLYEKFKFVLTAPSSIGIHPVVYKIDNATGVKVQESESRLSPIPLDDGRRNLYEWNAANVRFEAYRFDWTM